MSAEVSGRERVESIAHLDEDPACSYSQHRGDLPASWAVWLSPRRCGCPGSDFTFFCQPCWDYRNQTGLVHCHTCGDPSTAMSRVIRVERLR